MPVTRPLRALERTAGRWASYMHGLRMACTGGGRRRAAAARERVAGDHQLLVGRDRHRPASRLPAVEISGAVPRVGAPGRARRRASAAARRPRARIGGGVLADAGGEHEAVEPAHGRGERAGVAARCGRRSSRARARRRGSSLASRSRTSLLMPERPLRPAVVVEQALDARRRPCPLVRADRGRRRGRAGPARVPIGRPSRAVKPMVLSTLRPARMRAHARRRCPDGRRPPGRAAISGATVGQARGDVLVGQAVEAVAAHALLGRARPGWRSGRRPRDGRGGRRCRSRRPAGSPGGRARIARIGGQVVRLVQRRQRDQRAPARPAPSSSTSTGAIVSRAAMHDAVADARRGAPPSWPRSQPPRRPSAPRAGRSAASPGVVRRSTRLAPRRPWRMRRGLGADALDLALERRVEAVAVGDIEELELDARRAGVERPGWRPAIAVTPSPGAVAAQAWA